MLDLKMLIANRVRDAMRRGEKNTAPDQYRTKFEKLNNKWGLTFNDDRIVAPTQLRKKQLDTLPFGHAGATQITAACMSSGKKLKYQIPKNEFGKLKTLTEPVQEIQIDFSGKLNNKKLNGEHQILIAIDRFSKWPTAKICKLSETKEVLNFLKQKFKLYGILEKIKTDKWGGRLSQKNIRSFATQKTLKLNIVHRECTPVREQ